MGSIINLANIIKLLFVGGALVYGVSAFGIVPTVLGLVGFFLLSEMLR